MEFHIYIFIEIVSFLTIFLFDNDVAIRIIEAKKYFNKNEIDADLIFIKSNFSSLTTSLKKIKIHGLLLSNYLEIIDYVEKLFETLRGQIYR